MNTIAIGADDAAFDFRNKIIEYLKEKTFHLLITAVIKHQKTNYTLMLPIMLLLL